MAAEQVRGQLAGWSLPAAIATLAPGEAHLWRARCASAMPDPALAAAHLSAAELARAARLATPSLRRRYLCAHLLLHRLLTVYTGGQGYELGAGTHGKPCLVTPVLHPRLEFNLSHAGEMVIIALASGHSVGVDIEQIRPISDLAGITGMICSAREQAHLAALPEDARLAAFFRLWTRKEACLKMHGTGLAAPMATCDVLENPAGVTLLDLTLNDVPLEELASCQEAQTGLPHAYLGAVALPAATTVRVNDAHWQQDDA